MAACVVLGYILYRRWRNDRGGGGLDRCDILPTRRRILLEWRRWFEKRPVFSSREMAALVHQLIAFLDEEGDFGRQSFVSVCVPGYAVLGMQEDKISKGLMAVLKGDAVEVLVCERTTMMPAVAIVVLLGDVTGTPLVSKPETVRKLTVDQLRKWVLASVLETVGIKVYLVLETTLNQFYQSILKRSLKGDLQNVILGMDSVRSH
jgi:intracellular sulfur oxidation DsrE/DsrF family protein